MADGKYTMLTADGELNFTTTPQTETIDAVGLIVQHAGMVNEYLDESGVATKVSAAASLPVTALIADGANVALGATTDGAAAADDSNASMISLFKRWLSRWQQLIDEGLPIVDGAAEEALETLVTDGIEINYQLPAGPNTIGGTTDAGPAWTSVRGVSGAAVVSADATTAAAVTDAPTSGQKIVITDIVFSSDTAMNLLFEEETSGTDLFKVFVPANGAGQITPRGKCKLATADKKLTVKASVAGNIAVTVFYYSEA